MIPPKGLKVTLEGFLFWLKFIKLAGKINKIKIHKSSEFQGKFASAFTYKPE
jgi:hypothetical protein